MRNLFCVLVTVGFLASACSGATSDTEPGSDAAPEPICGGVDNAPGLELSFDGAGAQVRNLIREATSNGAGIDPRVDGVTSTTPILVTVGDVESFGVTLEWDLGATTFEDPSITVETPIASLSGVSVRFFVGDPEPLSQSDEISDAATSLLARDIATYGLTESIDEGETRREPDRMINPLTASVEDATLTITHLGMDDLGCEAVRVTRHLGPDAVVDDLDGLIEELRDPDARPDAFAEVGFDGVVVQTATYRFDHEIGRVRQIEFIEAWGIFGAGGIDTRVENRVFTDVTDS